MNLLTLKVVFWNAKRKAFCSPSRKEFAWPTGIVQSECHQCQFTMLEDCSCGIWSSPNPEVLHWYSGAPTSVLVLMNTYGRSVIMNGAFYKPGSFVLRSKAARIVAVVDPSTTMKMTPARELASIHGANVYEMSLFPYPLVQEMITESWKQHTKQQIDPYQIERK